MKKSKGFDDSFRLKIIEEYLSGASKYSLVKKYNLSNTQLIYRWLRTFGVEDAKKASPPIITEMEENEEIKRLKQELRLAKKALADSELKAKAYDRMIDIAESRFKIAIRKKPGTKQ